MTVVGLDTNPVDRRPAQRRCTRTSTTSPTTSLARGLRSRASRPSTDPSVVADADVVRRLRADAARRGGRPRPRLRCARPPRRSGARHAGHACHPGVDDLPGHDRGGASPRCCDGRRPACRAATSSSPSRPSASTRATRRTACATPRRSSAASTAECTRRAPRPSTAGSSTRSCRPRAPRGRDGQAAREHLPARQHRAGQRDGCASAHELDIDLWDAIDCAETKPFGYMAFRPGPGRRRSLHPGRPVLPQPPGQGAARLLVPHGRAGGGDQHRCSALRRQPRCATCSTTAAARCKGSRVLLLGVTYKANISDCRESPADPLAKRLLAWGADLAYHDPYVPVGTRHGAGGPADDRGSATSSAEVAAADVVVLLQTHAEYDVARSPTGAVLLDTRGVVTETDRSSACRGPPDRLETAARDPGSLRPGGARHPLERRATSRRKSTRTAGRAAFATRLAVSIAALDRPSKSGSPTTRLSASASCRASPTSHTASFGSSSGMPPTVDPTGGRPRAMASTMARGNPSLRDGRQNTSCSSRSAASCSRPSTCPRTRTAPGRSRRRLSSRRSWTCLPPPAKVRSIATPSRASRAAASRKTLTLVPALVAAHEDHAWGDRAQAGAGLAEPVVLDANVAADEGWPGRKQALDGGSRS